MQKWPENEKGTGSWKIKSQDDALAPYLHGKMKDKLLTVEEMDLDKGKADKRVVINVGGHRHETWISTLEMIPGNRLATLAELEEDDESYDLERNEFFFDRNPRAFGVIMQYYRTGELHVDQSICGNVLKREFQYWGIEEQDIEACCWTEYSKFTEHLDALRDLDENFTSFHEDGVFDNLTKGQRFKTLVWTFLEEPASPIFSRIYAIISMFFVALAITIFVLETHKLFQVDAISGERMDVVSPGDGTPTGNLRACCCDEVMNATYVQFDPQTHPVLKVLDYICLAFFLIEVLIRFSFCPNRFNFFKDALNVIDVVCLIPHFTAIILVLVTNATVAGIIKVFMVLRVVRVLRIFKLMKHYSAFKILVYTIKVSTKELLLMIVFLMSGVLMFASLIHYIEKDNFPNIPIAIWWAIVTMTTVGYGDKYPVNYAGYGIGCLCVICGVLVIAFTVPIVVNNFSLYYQHAQTRIKLPTKKKKDIKAAVNKRAQRRRMKSASVDSAQTDVTSVPSRPPSKHRQMTNHKVAPQDRVTPVEAAFVPNEKFAEEMEAQSKKLMDTLQEADEKHDNERKRQEFMLKMKKEKRLKGQAGAKNDKKEIDGKLGDDQEFVN